MDRVCYSHAEPGFTADKLTDCTFRLFPLGSDFFFPFHLPFSCQPSQSRFKFTAESQRETDSDILFLFFTLSHGNNHVRLNSQPIIGSTTMGEKKHKISQEGAVLVNRLGFHQF